MRKVLGGRIPCGTGSHREIPYHYHNRDYAYAKKNATPYTEIPRKQVANGRMDNFTHASTQKLFGAIFRKWGCILQKATEPH